jgi:hypothetical protein
MQAAAHFHGPPLGSSSLWVKLPLEHLSNGIEKYGRHWRGWDEAGHRGQSAACTCTRTSESMAL